VLVDREAVNRLTDERSPGEALHALPFEITVRHRVPEHATRRPRSWSRRPSHRAVCDLPHPVLMAETAMTGTQAGSIVRPVASIHWGSKWGYHVPPERQRFARRLIVRQDHHGGAVLGALGIIGATSVASTSDSIERCSEIKRWL
jgi:hypothetical protein